MRMPCVVDARLAEAMTAGLVDVQVVQRTLVHADGAGEDLGLVCAGRGFLAVPGGLLLELLDDEKELFLFADGLDAGDLICLPLQKLDLTYVSYPLRTLGRTQRGPHLGIDVAFGALGGRLGHLLLSCWFAFLKGQKRRKKRKYIFFIWERCMKGSAV